MAGNQFYGVIGENRGAAYADAAQNILGQIQQHKAAAQAQQIESIKAALEPYRSTPDIFNARVAQLPPAMQAIVAQIYGPLSAQTTPAQESAIAAEKLKAAQSGAQNSMISSGPQFTPPVPGGVGPTQPGGFQQFQGNNDFHRAVFGADMPKDQMDASLNYSTMGDAGLAGAQQIASKQVLDANQQQQASQDTRDFNQIKLPESKSLIGDRAATQAKNYADVGKIKEETRGLRDTNNMFAPSVAAPAPSGGGDITTAPPLVRMLVERQFDPMLMRRWKPEQQAAILAQVQQYDPKFSMADYPQQVATKKSFTSGPYAQAATSANQLIGHVKTLNDSFDRLNNGRFPKLNAVNNYVGQEGGSSSTQAALGSFNTAADAVATEAARTFKGTGTGAEREIQEWRKNVSPNMAPAAFKASVDTLFNLLGSRLGTMKSQYDQGVGYGKFDVLTPKSRIILQKMGRNADDLEGEGGAPSGPASSGSSQFNYVIGKGLVPVQ